MYPAEIPVQIPWLPVADVLTEYQWLILRQYTHGVDAGSHAVGKRKVNNAVFAPKRHRGLCQ